MAMLAAVGLRLPGGRRLDKCPEEFSGERAAIEGSLRVPLHAEHERRAFWALFHPFDGLHRALQWTNGDRLQLVANPRYGLVMAGIDQNGGHCRLRHLHETLE